MVLTMALDLSITYYVISYIWLAFSYYANIRLDVFLHVKTKTRLVPEEPYISIKTISPFAIALWVNWVTIWPTLENGK